MPMPMPRSGEDREDFMDRCMADPMMNEDYEDGDQRAAVCNQVWRDREKRKEQVMHKNMVVPAEFKAEGDKGRFSGYAAIFENLDLGGDVIRKGAFKEFVQNADGMIKVLFQHDSFGMTASGGLPIGLAKVEQNARGLKFDGELVMDDPFVQRVHTHMKAGTLDGMSIGYDVLPGGASMMESGYRELTGLKLWEISPVTFGMNPKAGITDVKAVTDIRELEDLLRDVAGLSRAQAKLHAGAIWKTRTGQRDADDGGVEKELQRLIASVETLGR